MHLLVIEDEELDIIALQRAFRKKNVQFETTIAADGAEALQLLRDCADNAPTFFNGLVILLDINMPRMNGLEFLEELRNEPELKRLPVFVLTTSDEHRDVSAAYALGISGYLLKQNIGEDFEKLIRLLEVFSSVVLLPEIHSL